jgi:hypothetical protein
MIPSKHFLQDKESLCERGQVGNLFINAYGHIRTLCTWN